MPSQFQAAVLFFNQGRWTEAERALRASLAEDPDHAEAMAYLALTLTHVDRIGEAEKIARQAVACAPGEPFAHYALGHALADQKKFKEADSHGRQALELDPENAELYSLMASISARKSEWNRVLEWAEKDLELDSENEGCRHLRSLALTQLGRTGQATEVIDESLREDPDNPLAHANKGWAALHARQYKAASEHFTEALRLNPNLEWARRGLIESLKARNPIYGVMLRFFLWMGRLSGGSRIGMIVGFVLLQRALSNFAGKGGTEGAISGILLALLLFFIFLTWTADPLFNLLLRLHPLGRHALNSDETRTTNIVGGLFFGGLILVGAGFLLLNLHILVLGGVFVTMVLPVAGSLAPQGRRNRTPMLVITLALGGLGVFAALFQLPLTGMYLLGLAGFTWIAMILSR